MTPTFTLHIRPCALEPGEAAVLAGIWRRAWSSAHRDIETLEPIAHWLSRVQSEFRAPAELLVTRGQAVKRGQVIAKAGESGHADAPQLHFEIRQGAKPVDPLAYLPKRS